MARGDRRRRRTAAGRANAGGVRNVFPSSFIRTVTVGSGLGPDLLTLPFDRQALAGSVPCSTLPPVGIFTPP